jgi:hypothetical protein
MSSHYSYRSNATRLCKTYGHVAGHSDRPVLIVKRRPNDAIAACSLLLTSQRRPPARSRRLTKSHRPRSFLPCMPGRCRPSVGLATRQAAEKNVHDENELLRRRVVRQASDHLVALASPPRPPRVEMIEPLLCDPGRDRVVSPRSPGHGNPCAQRHFRRHDRQPGTRIPDRGRLRLCS